MQSVSVLFLLLLLDGTGLWASHLIGHQEMLPDETNGMLTCFPFACQFGNPLDLLSICRN